jgi:hypothetical protein
MQPSLLQYDGMAGPISLVYQISVFGSVVYNAIQVISVKRDLT